MHLQSGHEACLALSDGAEVGAGPRCGSLLKRWSDDMADRVDDGRALRAISLFSTTAITSFTDLVRMSGIPSISRRMSES